MGVLRSPSEIQIFLEIRWLLSEGSSYVVLCIPRVKVNMYLVEPNRGFVVYRCQLVMV